MRSEAARGRNQLIWTGLSGSRCPPQPQTLNPKPKGGPACGQKKKSAHRANGLGGSRPSTTAYSIPSALCLASAPSRFSPSRSLRFIDLVQENSVLSLTSIALDLTRTARVSPIAVVFPANSGKKVHHGGERGRRLWGGAFGGLTGRPRPQ